MSQTNAANAASTGAPMPIPTPRAIFPVLVSPDEEEDGVDDEEDGDDPELRVLFEVLVDVAELVAEVDVADASVMLKYDEMKPSGWSELIQKKKTLE